MYFVNGRGQCFVILGMAIGFLFNRIHEESSEFLRYFGDFIFGQWLLVKVPDS